MPINRTNSPADLSAQMIDWRLLTLLVGIANLAFWWLIRQENPRLADPLSGRFAVSAYAIGVAGLSVVVPGVRRHITSLALIGVWLFTAEYFLLLIRNNLDQDLLVGTLIVIAVVCTVLTTRRMILGYMGLVAAGGSLTWALTDSSKKSFFLFSLSFLIGMFYFSRYKRLRVLNELYRAVAERDEKERQLEIHRALSAQSSKMAALGEMAGGVAHEINSPLAIVQLNAEQLEELLGESDIDRKSLIDRSNAISLTVKRIAKIVQGLRAFSRSGRGDPMVPEQLRRIVDDTLALCGEKFRESGIELTVEIDNSSLSVLCRSVEISQVLLNLLNNASDALSCAPEKWIKVEARALDKYAQIVVRDSGAGIAPGIQQSIFQPFFTTKDVGKGTGLGLSVSKGIVESHGGTLVLDVGTPNTTFVISLPRV